MSSRIMRDALLAVGWLLAVGSISAETFVFKALDTLGGHHSTAKAINQDGQVVGTAANSKDADQVVIWSSSGVPTALPGLVGRFDGEVLAVSAQGNAAGRLWLRGHSRPVVWWQGAVSELNVLPGDDGGMAEGVNDAGLVIGRSFGPSGQRPIMWQDGVATDLPLLSSQPGANGWAKGLNAKGQIVGESRVEGLPAFQTRAVLWQNGAVIDLGQLGDSYSSAYAINDEGQIVGFSGIREQWVGVDGESYNKLAAVTWRHGKIIQLGDLGGVSSVAAAVNNLGEAVGFSRLPNHTDRAVIWRGTKVQDLNDLMDEASKQAGWELEHATGINDKGWIVGVAYNRRLPTSSSPRAFLLRPVPERTCFVRYRVIDERRFSFRAEVTVRNLKSTPLEGWRMNWVYDAPTLVLGGKQVRLHASKRGRVVQAEARQRSQAIAGDGQVAFTFRGLKLGAMPQVSAMSASLAGESCAVSVEP